MIWIPIPSADIKINISTGTVCLIYMPQNYNKTCVILDGETISAADDAYMKQSFMPKSKSSAPVEYRTLSLSNIKSISINHEKYDVMIDDWELGCSWRSLMLQRYIKNLKIILIGDLLRNRSLISICIYINKYLSKVEYKKLG